MNMIRTTISLPSELHEQLRQEAFQKRTSISAVLTDRVYKKTIQKKKKTPEQLLAELKKLAKENDRQNPGISFSDKLIEMRYEQ